MTKQEEVYMPLLNSFINDCKIYKGKVDVPGIFIPHTLPKYHKAAKKYFYCGQDTYGWIHFDKMIKYFEENDIFGYINENNGWPPSIYDIIEYSNNKEGNFWTLIIRLHIFLHRNELIDINELTEDDEGLLEEIGWGNLNSIELPRSLDNQGRWESLNKDYYWDIKEKSRKFDSLKYILDIYDPDYIFIFNWDDGKEEDVFRGLDPQRNKKDYCDKVISTYNFNDYKAKVIWCPHPNRLRWQSMNINELIDEIIIRL